MGRKKVALQAIAERATGHQKKKKEKQHVGSWLEKMAKKKWGNISKGKLSSFYHYVERKEVGWDPNENEKSKAKRPEGSANCSKRSPLHRKKGNSPAKGSDLNTRSRSHPAA